MPAISSVRTPMRLLAIPRRTPVFGSLCFLKKSFSAFASSSGWRGSPPTTMPISSGSRAIWMRSAVPLLTTRAAASCELPILRPTTRFLRPQARLRRARPLGDRPGVARRSLRFGLAHGVPWRRPGAPCATASAPSAPSAAWRACRAWLPWPLSPAPWPLACCAPPLPSRRSSRAWPRPRLPLRELGVLLGLASRALRLGLREPRLGATLLARGLALDVVVGDRLGDGGGAASACAGS